MAQQFDQQAAVFRHQLPTGQPIIQRKAVSTDNLRARAEQLDAKARRIEHARTGVPDTPKDVVGEGFDSRYLAEELRELAALRREEAERLQSDPATMAEKDSLADQLEALAAEVERRSDDSSR